MKVASRLNESAPPTYQYVDTTEAMHAVARCVREAGLAAIDSEGDSLHHYYQKVCLIQLAVGDEVFLVDPLTDAPVGVLLEALAGVSLVIHGADSDLRMLRRSLAFQPHGEVFDTMVAAQLLGYPQIGLAALVERFFDETLAKQGRKSDWSRRPLTDSQLAYAANDARYLLPLARRLRCELDRLGRLAWHGQSCRRVVELSVIDRPTEDADSIWRIKGIKDLSRRELGYVREIWRWREREAQRADVPPFKVLGNAQIIGLALWSARHPDRCPTGGPKLPRTCTGRRLGNLVNAIHKARDLPEAERPPRRKRSSGPIPPPIPSAQPLRDRCAEIARALGLDAAVLAPRAAVEAIAIQRARTVEAIMTVGGLTQWQAELIAPAAREIL